MIRKYREEDLEQVLAVWASASAVAHPFLSDEYAARVRDQIANVYLPMTETWVWVSDDRVVGFISMLGNEVGGFFVDPKFQRAGVGRALLDHARGSHEALEVEVFEANAIGRAFYRKYGFVVIHQTVHEETGFDVMRLRLPAN